MFPARFEVSNVALLRLKVFWDLMPCPDVFKEQVTLLFDQSTTDDEGCMFFCKGKSPAHHCLQRCRPYKPSRAEFFSKLPTYKAESCTFIQNA
jgi:hypothetical protein